jgi:hypothetical protein
MFKARCSSLHLLMTKPKSGTGLSETAKSMIKQSVIEDVYGRTEIKSKYLDKGNLLEDEAIKAVGLITARQPKKHKGRMANEWISGECDFISPSCIEDTKCSWSIDTFPFFQEDAEKDVKKAGYDWQGQGYMWLYDRPVHYVHFVLLPTPYELLGFNDSQEFHIDLVEKIPLKKRIKTVVIERDESLYEQVIEKVTIAREYYNKLLAEIK